MSMLRHQISNEQGGGGGGGGGGSAQNHLPLLFYKRMYKHHLQWAEVGLYKKMKKIFFWNGTISCHNGKDFTGATLYAALHVNEQMPIISRVLLSIFLACSLLFVLCRIFSADDILF